MSPCQPICIHHRSTARDKLHDTTGRHIMFLRPSVSLTGRHPHAGHPHNCSQPRAPPAPLATPPLIAVPVHTPTFLPCICHDVEHRTRQHQPESKVLVTGQCACMASSYGPGNVPWWFQRTLHSQGKWYSSTNRSLSPELHLAAYASHPVHAHGARQCPAAPPGRCVQHSLVTQHADVHNSKPADLHGSSPNPRSLSSLWKQILDT